MVAMSMPKFKPNYPYYDDHYTLLSTPERTGALPEYTGKGVVIAFIDAGFYPHPDIHDRVLVHVDATTNQIVENFYHFETGIFSWHGQMTSVIAAGNGHVSDGKYRGIASKSRLVLIKVSNRRKQIKEPDILRGLRWLVQNHHRYHIKVVNISVGGDFSSDDPANPIYVAIKALSEAGVTILVAGGNKGTKGIVPPASSPHAITIGGYNDHNALDRERWTLYPNSYGVAYDGKTKPDICGPAVWIASPILPWSSMATEARWLAPLFKVKDSSALKNLLWGGHSDIGLEVEQVQNPDEKVYSLLQERINAHKLIDERHQHVDGTSVSAAIVTSIVAQMLEAKPRLTPQQIRTILISTAYSLPAEPLEKQGAGAVDAAAAVRMATNL